MRKLAPGRVSEAVVDDLIDHERATCQSDQRLMYDEYSSGGSVLPVVFIDKAERLSGEFRHWLGLDKIVGKVSLVGGGIGHFTSMMRADSETGERVISRLIASAVADARAQGALPVCPFATEAQVRLLRGPQSVAASAEPAPSHYTMQIAGLKNADEFISRLGKQSRKVWRRDRSRAEARDLSYSIEPLTVASCREAATALASTSARNGAESHPQLAEWRLLSILRRTGNHVLIRLKRGGLVKAYAVATEFSGVLDVHSYGIGEGEGEGGEMYHLMFTACLDYGTEWALNEIWFSIEHAKPKLARGCVEFSRWRISFL